MKYFSFPIRKINKVERLIDNLIQEEKYNDLIEFLEKNFKRLKNICERKTIYLKLRDEAKSKNDSIEDLLLEEYKSSTKKKIIRFILIPLRLFPKYDKYSSDASVVISKLILNEKFLEHIVKSHSYIFLKFFEIRKYYRDDFVDLIFRKLLSDTRSILYVELENSQNLSHYSNYWIIDSNKLIYYLFNKPKVAENLGVWRPVGEYIIEKLDYLKRHPELDNYNTNVQNFYESPRWKSDIFIAIHFFDIMVSQALYKNIEWHMWLYYYRYFVEGIVKNHSTDDIYYDELDEWPTKYEYLIYQIFHNMCNWLKSLDDLDSEQDNIKLENTNLTINNGNIPVSAINAIGQCMKVLFDSTTIGQHFKYYIFTIIFNLYFDLRRNESLINHSKVLAKAICYKFDFASGNLQPYYDFVEDSFENHFDKIPIPTDLIQEFRIILRNRATNI